jgi:prevent-host-death family protein
MQPLDVTRDIIPIARFKAHASALLRQMKKSDRPLVITQSGKPSAVVMNPEDYEELTEAARVVSKVLRGLESARVKTWSAEEVRASAKAKARSRRHAR